MNAASTLSLLALALAATGFAGCRKPSSPNDLPSAPIESSSSSGNSIERAPPPYTPTRGPTRGRDRASEERTVVEETVYTIVNVGKQMQPNEFPQYRRAESEHSNDG